MSGRSMNVSGKRPRVSGGGVNRARCLRVSVVTQLAMVDKHTDILTTVFLLIKVQHPACLVLLTIFFCMGVNEMYRQCMLIFLAYILLL